MIEIKRIIKELEGCTFIGDQDISISKLKNFDEFNTDPESLMWVNTANLDRLKRLAVGTIICPKIYTSKLNKNVNYILVSNPRLSFLKVSRKFFTIETPKVISRYAIIHPSVKLGKEVTIGNFAVVNEGVEIGDNVTIGDNTVLMSKSKIHQKVTIGANCTIGGTGFGYEKDDSGEYLLIPHLGDVVIKENVEIGNNSAIDRAVLGSTIIGESVKIDNLVHIAHGVKIGKNTLLMANSCVAGSTNLGENVWVGPSSSIMNKLNIGNNTTIGAGAVVFKDLMSNITVLGNPSRVIRE